jgi:hypothetical protein
MKSVGWRIGLPEWLIVIGSCVFIFVIVGSAWGYMRLRERVWGDLGRFAAAFALTTGFFAAAIALCQPRYLPLFRGMLHPRWPW